MGPLQFNSVFCHLRDAQKNLNQKAQFRFLGSSCGPQGPSEDQGEPTSEKQVLSVSVESAVECADDVLMTVRCDLLCLCCSKKSLRDLLDTHALSCHLLDDKEFLCGQDQ